MGARWSCKDAISSENATYTTGRFHGTDKDGRSDGNRLRSSVAVDFLKRYQGPISEMPGSGIRSRVYFVRLVWIKKQKPVPLVTDRFLTCGRWRIRTADPLLVRQMLWTSWANRPGTGANIIQILISANNCSQKNRINISRLFRKLKVLLLWITHLNCWICEKMMPGKVSNCINSRLL